MKLTNEQLREIEERAEKATPGPWLDHELQVGIYFDRGEGRTHTCILTLGDRSTDVAGYYKPASYDPQRQTDVAFIAASRTDIPRLLAHIAALEEDSKRYKEVLRDVRDNYDCDSDAHKYGTTCRCCAAEEALTEDEERRIQQLERLETAELKHFREEGADNQ